ncbi:urokinase-type plasminogen activator isoform X2 [Arapaima gigas]
MHSVKLGPGCLNGGTSVGIPYLHTEKPMFCICPPHFSGRHCEIEELATCFHGNGHHYRGTVAQSESGQQCLTWGHEVQLWPFRLQAIQPGIWSHNYCRNPDNRARPWCHVRKGFQIVQEFCNIPRCEAPSGNILHAPASSVCGLRSQKLQKIVGGKVTTVESQPWMAAIFRRSQSGGFAFLCGGSLISACWLLTAAHCFPQGPNMDAWWLTVFLGKDALNTTSQGKEQRFYVKEIIVHPNFDNSDGSYDHDIAILKISMNDGTCAKATNSVRTICLPPAHQMPHVGSSCVIAGYGKEHEGMWHNSQYLKEAKVNILPQDVCTSTAYYGKMVTGNMFCAGSPDWKKDACKGDSGGPLVCEVDGSWVLFGVISWGEGCSREFRPGVYTRVSRYSQWIVEKTGLPSRTTKLPV